MKDYFYYKVSYLVGSLRVEFDEFLVTKAGEITEKQAERISYDRAFNELAQKGASIEDFDFEVSNEMALRRWEKERIQEQDLKTSLTRSISDALAYSHEGGNV